MAMHVHGNMAMPFDLACDIYNLHPVHSVGVACRKAVSQAGHPIPDQNLSKVVFSNSAHSYEARTAFRGARN